MANPMTALETELVQALGCLTRVFTEGRNYDQCNPYSRPEIKKALRTIAKATGQNCHIYDVKLPTPDECVKP